MALPGEGGGFRTSVITVALAVVETTAIKTVVNRIGLGILMVVSSLISFHVYVGMSDACLLPRIDPGYPSKDPQFCRFLNTLRNWLPFYSFSPVVEDRGWAHIGNASKPHTSSAQIQSITGLSLALGLYASQG